MVTRGTKRSWRLFLPDGQAVPLGERRSLDTCRVLYRGEVFRGVVEARAQRSSNPEPRELFTALGPAGTAAPAPRDVTPRRGSGPATSTAESICEQAEPRIDPGAVHSRSGGRSLVPQLDPDSLFSDEGEPVIEVMAELPAPPVADGSASAASASERDTSGSISSSGSVSAAPAVDDAVEDELSLSDLSAVGAPAVDDAMEDELSLSDLSAVGAPAVDDAVEDELSLSDLSAVGALAAVSGDDVDVNDDLSLSDLSALGPPQVASDDDLSLADLSLLGADALLDGDDPSLSDLSAIGP